MRSTRLFLIVLVAFALLPNVGSAQSVRMTMYDDGTSCPGNCDAHVVFDAKLNGTHYAHSPDSAIAPFQKCTKGTECKICLTAGDDQCMNVMYRGAGPGSNTLDFTPAFYEEQCAKSSLPLALATKCTTLKQQARKLATRTNCIREPDSTGCDLMRSAVQRKTADQPLYDECVRVGEKQFNSVHAASAQRSNSCAYERTATGGPNSRGTSWRRLLPAACRPDTYVGRDGLDCCKGNPLADGPLGAECAAFYPTR